MSNPHEVVKVGQKVEVTVLEVDEARKRISLSMKGDPAAAKPAGGGSRGNNSNKGGRKEREEEPMDDFQAKLAKLKGMFK